MKNKSQCFGFSLLVLLFSVELHAGSTFQVPVENFEQKLNEIIENAPNGSEIVMPEGFFEMNNELVITKHGITLRGQGMKKTTLSFKHQKVGSQGVFGSADALVFSDFGVEDSAGTGMKVMQANSVTFRRVRVAWTRGPHEENGAYGLYPVMSRNVLIEDCEVTGASDAGVYVGQSQNIIVRRNEVFENVAGIEIENSRFADVYENHTYNNTAGILIFNLPNLPIKGGRQTRVFSNKVENNNLKNFSTEGGIVHLVPDGLGIFIMANSEVEVFKNTIRDNYLTGVSAVHYAISEKKYEDAGYDPQPRHIYIYDNTFSKRGFHFFRPTRMNIIIKLLMGLRTPEIVYDGIEDGTYAGKKLEDKDRLCIQNNKTFEGGEITYGNMHLDNQRKNYPYPGGPATFDIENHNCAFEPFPAVVLEPAPTVFNANQTYTTDEIKKKCSAKTTGVNWEAIELDCPKLSNYNLFKNAVEPTQNPNERGFEYKLNNELFTDYAEKNRFIFLPPNQQIQYASEGVLDFPKGTIITKTFSFYIPDQNNKSTFVPIETRLLIKRKKGWDTLDYIWNLAVPEAFLMLGGDVRNLKVLAHNQNPMNINYGIPNKRQCASCHVTDVSTRGLLNPIGPKAKFLNWDIKEASSGKLKNQLVQWSDKGYLKNLPADLKTVPQVAQWDVPGSGTLDQRAKAYLEVNCAHCHNPKGPAANTALYLLTDVATDTANYGHCKPPTAAGFASGGRDFDINPGKADESILLFRLQENHLAVRMPQLGRTVAHVEANDVIKQWINSLTGSCK